MAKITSIKHKIQKYILSQLSTHSSLRFRDMRPPRVDTNLYSYHLKLLQKNNLVEKTDRGYGLTLDGMVHVARTGEDMAETPAIKIMVIIQDGYGGTLMIQTKQQPFIGSWTLPQGYIVSNDSSLAAAADRVVAEQFGASELGLSHVGDCYIRIRQDGATKLSSLVHVLYAAVDDRPGEGQGQWMAPHQIVKLGVEPGVDQLIARAFFRDKYFFEEFDVDW